RASLPRARLRPGLEAEQIGKCRAYFFAARRPAPRIGELAGLPLLALAPDRGSHGRDLLKAGGEEHRAILKEKAPLEARPFDSEYGGSDRKLLPRKGPYPSDPGGPFRGRPQGRTLCPKVKVLYSFSTFRTAASIWAKCSALMC